MKKYITGIISLSVLFGSCTKKDNPSPTVDTGTVKMEFFNNVGGSSLNLNDQWYVNENGDSFTVSTFNYYISNVKLTGANGNNYTETNSYHLVKQSDAASTSFNMSDVPVGKYTGVTVTIGVDSAHNVSGAQTGALDPTNGMFWSWNTGYIMLKFEGKSPKSTQPDNFIAFHCGGFSGPNNVVRTVSFTFSQPIEVSKGGTPHIHLTADVLALFKSPNKIDFSQIMDVQMPGADAKKIADNYANMFTITYAGL